VLRKNTVVDDDSRCFIELFLFWDRNLVRLHVSYNAIADLFRRYYARNGPDLAVFTISMDGSTPQRVNATTNLGVNQRLLWSSKSLGPGNHTITLTHDGANGAWFALDFFRLVISDMRQ
jgi:hypothetical protein